MNFLFSTAEGINEDLLYPVLEYSAEQVLYCNACGLCIDSVNNEQTKKMQKY